MPGGSAVECLPLAQSMILESQDRVPHRAPSEEQASFYVPSMSLLLRVSLSWVKFFKTKCAHQDVKWKDQSFMQYCPCSGKNMIDTHRSYEIRVVSLHFYMCFEWSCALNDICIEKLALHVAKTTKMNSKIHSNNVLG